MSAIGRARMIDVALAVALAAIAFAEASGHGDIGGYRAPGSPLVGGVLAALAPLPLVIRRSRPLASAAAVAALLTLPHLVVGYDAVFVGGLVVLAVSVESAARYGRRSRNRFALLFPVPGLILLAVLFPTFGPHIVEYLALLLVGWTLGVFVRALIEQRDALAGELAARRAAEELLLQRSVTGERRRIARELHDVIAHCVSLMVLQSGGARLRLEIDPAGSTAALARIESAGQEALTELQRLLGVLTADPDDDPSASLADLGRLVDQVRDAGLAMRLHVEGDPAGLPAGLARSLYRVVQECLTNALKHGSGSPADLRLAVLGDRVELDVQNGVRTSEPLRLPGGNGLTGIEERIAAFGGSLSAAPESGRYRVHAVVPLTAAPG